jgi:ubiquinone/menaquinone biosynthesis C-methylase UbiE
MPFRDDEFDLVYAFATLEHILDLESVFREMVRVCRPGGGLYSVAAPLWNCRAGPHWGSMFDDFPWIHLRYSTDEIISFCERRRRLDPQAAYISPYQIQYCMDSRFFNKRWARDYLDICAGIRDVDIIRNDVDHEDSRGVDEDIIRELLKRGYEMTELFGLTHTFVARKRTRKRGDSMDLSDCRCVRCDASVLYCASNLTEDIHRDAVLCKKCGASYDSLWGVPFIGHYEKNDFLGLVEIAANSEQDYQYLSPSMLDSWEVALRSYHDASDREAFLSEAESKDFPVGIISRYHEWVEVVSLTQEFIGSMRGSRVLDVGAGLGIDGYRHAAAGANVTAVEFSPFLARAGARSLRMMRWIGGFSHVLPFARDSFDFVFANAALHHMRDIPAAISEMLRVLRPGGYLISTGDPYRADDAGEEFELQLFDRNPVVLNGVNERIPCLADFLEALECHRECVVPELFTHSIYNAVVDGKRHEFIPDRRQWHYESDVGMLRQTSGSLSMRIQLKSPITSAARIQSTSAIRAADIPHWMPNQAEAMVKLSSLAPDSAVNASFPGTRSDKLQLLNGWLSPTGAEWRQAYRRARWYLRRRRIQRRISFEVCSELGGLFTVLVNGESSVTVSLPPAEWKRLSIDISNAPIDKTFVMELRLERETQEFSEGLFLVRRRQFDRPEMKRLIRAAARVILPRPAARLVRGAARAIGLRPTD